MGDHEMTLTTRGNDNFILHDVQRQALYGRKIKCLQGLKRVKGFIILKMINI